MKPVDKVYAPELINKKKCDQKTDIWFLGAVLYEMCTQNQPFTVKKDLQATAKNIMTGNYDLVPDHFS